jgi:hypothetical protein
MKRSIVVAPILLCAIAQTGCVSSAPTRALATPWGAIGIHSFRPTASGKPDDKAVNAEVARLLDEQDGSGTFVAAR